MNIYIYIYANFLLIFDFSLEYFIKIIIDFLEKMILCIFAQF